MSILLAVAGALAIGIALAHSLLGERYIVGRLLRRDDLPRLLGGQWFTRRTIRFAWHLTSIAWVGLGAILLVLANETTPSLAVLTSDTDTSALAARVAAVTFLASAVVTAAASRFRHLAWIVFLVIGVLALAA